MSLAEVRGTETTRLLGAGSDGTRPDKLVVDHLNAWYGKTHAIEDISLGFPDKQATAIIGPSGCGKSTFIRCLNRIHETQPRARSDGRVLLDGADIYQDDPTEVRRKVGMVFQRPNVFPTMSIFANVASGLKLHGGYSQDEIDRTVIASLKRAALWDEVKEKLDTGALALSGGQQQRLCIARALAVEPEVLLMDEPASSLDPISTARIEDLVFELKKQVPVIIVTHNMQQAARIADRTAFFYLGKLVEVAPTAELFERPKEKLTESYITGRFG
jgi:phosphate transport system ATP-binding protein